MTHFGLLFVKFRKDRYTDLRNNYLSLIFKDVKTVETSDSLMYVFTDRLKLPDINRVLRMIESDSYKLQESAFIYRDVDTETLIYKHLKHGLVIENMEFKDNKDNKVNEAVRAQFTPLNLILYTMEDKDIKKLIQRNLYRELKAV